MSDIYHVYNRSISEMKVFTNDIEYVRFINAIRFYQTENPQIKFSDYMEQISHRRGGMKRAGLFPDKGHLVEIIAYCIMPTHFHLLLGQTKDRGISVFTNNLLNSYSRYFNTKCKRKGTLWEGKTKRTIVKSNEQLLHLTRYIHLNPVTAYIVDNPERWIFSSYREYLLNAASEDRMCSYDCLLNIDVTSYKNFVESGISYQREMAKVKKSNPTAAVGG